jgi:hypothetical protein
VTLNANIAPFAPFVIEHDINSGSGGKLLLCHQTDADEDNLFGNGRSKNRCTNISTLVCPCVV